MSFEGDRADRPWKRRRILVAWRPHTTRRGGASSPRVVPPWTTRRSLPSDDSKNWAWLAATRGSPDFERFSPA